MSSERFFLVRLLAPRATFLQDMTESERAIMGEHGEYWRRQLAAGKVVVFGPVAAPTGPWGLGVLRLRDESEIASFQAEDPAIQRIAGMRYEVLPMLTAVFAQ